MAEEAVATGYGWNGLIVPTSGPEEVAKFTIFAVRDHAVMVAALCSPDREALRAAVVGRLRLTERAYGRSGRDLAREK